MQFYFLLHFIFFVSTCNLRIREGGACNSVPCYSFGKGVFPRNQIYIQLIYPFSNTSVSCKNVGMQVIDKVMILYVGDNPQEKAVGF